MARVMKVYDLYWSPTGQKIDTVTASTKKAAIRKAPAPYSRYKGEIYAEDRGTASNPSIRRTKMSLKQQKTGSYRSGSRALGALRDKTKARKMTKADWREIVGWGGAGPGVIHKARVGKRGNPGVKTISLKNFTGKVRINPGVKAGAVTIAGIGKKGKR